MSVLESLPGVETFIREKIEGQRKTIREVVEELKTIYPAVTRGISVASISRFFSAHNIHRTFRLNDSTLDHLVSLNAMKPSCSVLLFVCRTIFNIVVFGIKLLV